MNEYVVLFVNEERPYVQVTSPNSYKNIISTNHGFLHENWGNFYSATRKEQLAQKFYDSLDTVIDNKPLNEEITLIPNKKGKISSLENKTYIITDSEGFTFVPETDDTTEHSKFVCELYAMEGLEPLFTTRIGGTFQGQVKKKKREYQNTISKLKEATRPNI